MPQIDQNDPCPCESGNTARECCFFRGRCEPREVDTRPKGPATGFSLKDCYAAPLRDCSPDLTREHYISDNLLRELSEPAVVVSGLSWQKEELQRVGIPNLQSRMLCRRHNNALSRLDEQAGRLFRSVKRVERSLQAGDGSRWITLFPGIDIERWLLKALIGLCAAGEARTPEGEPIPWVTPELWLRILFGQYGFPSQWGLYFAGRVGTRLDYDPGHVRFAPLTHMPAEISGFLAELVGIRFALALRDARRRAGMIEDHSVQRPNVLRFVDEPSRTEQFLCFVWRGPFTTEIGLNWSRDRPREVSETTMGASGGVHAR